jgi:isoleucyl-tRNA synthetase
MFQEVPARPDYVALEEEVLRLWADRRVFEQLREQTKGGPRWSFLDGPITANNPMGVHHAWGRTYKDLYNRYHAMLGHELRWQQGFDCQGLWVEVEVEKELGFKSKRDIEAYGVANFVNKCKERVFRYADVIAGQSKRLGYWMDWDNSYFTLADENNYGIWGFLKLCHERGWLRRGHDVMPWCPRCGTALSEHEIATEGYAERTHLALTVAFPLLDRPGEALLAWTTTPWTLPANVAAAVHPELTYVRVAQAEDTRHETRDDETKTRSDVTGFWVVEEALGRLPLSLSPGLASPGLLGSHASWKVVERRPGAELVGWRYAGPFDALEAQAGVEHRVVAWDEVSADEGTGVVHVAPGAGKEDFALGQELGLATLAPLDDDGVYVAGYGALSGRKASDVPEDVAADLEARGLLFGRERYTHRYPVCWRCGTELVFRLVDEWLVGMDALRGPMMDAAREARWLPSFGLERELDWLRNMGDWMISKKRYWGLALPIYPCEACGHVTVVGSKQELRERAVAGWEEFEGHSPHRPWVDEVLVACERCGAATRRVPDVGNPWLDAGIVAFSTLRYHEDREHWREWFPADLVLESFPGQFRNWFYALLAMSTALDGRAPFKTLLGHATVKGENGDDMHKSKGNSIPFEVAAGWHGVEPLRWMYASAPLERNLLFGRGLAEETARSLQPLWEVYRFFVTYANLDDWRLVNGDWRLEQHHLSTSNLQSPIDRWLLARLSQLVGTARERLSDYDARGFTREIEAFLDDLSNWYVRRSRRRFWGAGRDDAPYAALHLTLVTLARLLAPVLPFLSEALYQNLVRGVDPEAPDSVHLTGYPTADGSPMLNDVVSGQRSAVGGLLADMEVVRRVVALGRTARRAAGLRVRQPLQRLLVATSSGAEREALLAHSGELLDELNVKALELLEADDALSSYRLKPNLRLLGPRLGRRLPALAAALAALTPAEAAAQARAALAGRQVQLELEGGGVTLEPGELLVESEPLAGFAVAQEAGLQVALDTALTPELRREGAARDLVRAVQEARKEAGLALSDRISLRLHASDGELDALLAEWGGYVQEETLARELAVGPLPAGLAATAVDLDGVAVSLLVARK